MKENEVIEGTVVEEKKFFTKKKLIGGGIAAAFIAALATGLVFVLKTKSGDIETEDNENNGEV